MGEPAFCLAGPYIYAFDGQTWRYETSVGGAALLGQARQLEHDAGKRVRFLPLWAKLESARVLDDRSVQARLHASEDAIVYLDHVQLWAVHHPPGHEVVSSSAMQWRALGQKDPQQFWAFPSDRCRVPVAASWCGELDQREALSQRTGEPAAHALDRHNFYELDFGPVEDERRVWLLLDGWKFKRPRGLAPTEREQQAKLELLDDDGRWRSVMALAAPRGDRKTIAVDLSRQRWPTGRYTMRVWTGTDEGGHALWCLDRARLVEATSAPLSTTTIAIERAQLELLGPPILDAADRERLARGPAREPRTFGRFTRLGDVTALVRAPDERLVVMREGDAVSLRFANVPPPPPEFETTLFVMVDLVFKLRVTPGADGPTDLSERVDPLPRRHMGRYDAHAPTHDHPEFHRYLARANTREHLPEDP